jgi:hypothetical protein
VEFDPERIEEREARIRVQLLVVVVGWVGGGPAAVRDARSD